MKILAMERDIAGITEAQFKPYLRAEALRVWELYREGVFRELYFRKDYPAAVLVLECANTDDAHAALNSLPLVKAGLIEFEVIPLVTYPGFARLFAGDVPYLLKG